MKRVIIAGGRDFDDFDYLYDKMVQTLGGTFWNEHACAEEFDFNVRDIMILSGKARGADTLGERFAEQCGIKVIEFAADWDKHGKAAGPIRNEELAQNADVAIVFWDGKSRGSRNMIDNALKYGLELHVFRY